MERWKEFQIEQLTRAKEIENAFPILKNFANNIGFRSRGLLPRRLNRFASITSRQNGTQNTKKTTVQMIQ